MDAHFSKRGQTQEERNNESDLENADLLFKFSDEPSVSSIGTLVPVKCGHRSFPKEKDKERKPLDLILEKSGFTSPTAWT